MLSKPDFKIGQFTLQQGQQVDLDHLRYADVASLAAFTSTNPLTSDFVCSVELKHFFDDMRAVMEYWLRIDLLSGLPENLSKTKLDRALNRSADASQLPDFIAGRLSDNRGSGGTIRNLGAHHYIMDVTIEHPEGPAGLVCDELEQKEGMKPGSRKLLLVRVETTYKIIREALQTAGHAVS